MSDADERHEARRQVWKARRDAMTPAELAEHRRTLMPRYRETLEAIQRHLDTHD